MSTENTTITIQPSPKGDGWRSRKLWLSVALYGTGMGLGQWNLYTARLSGEEWLWLCGGLSALVLVTYGVLNVAELVTLVRGRAARRDEP